ncbi:MAG: acetate--CoA ligase family protein, partial [Gammaproteobacteria bacterium]|nr:acetate--CoA ligase family protein [Gammaproteobacteria bacterium]
MNLHEYQAKQLFGEYGIPAPEGEVAWNAEEAINITKRLAGERTVVKAQVHAGGRGKAGGVRIVAGAAEVEEAARDLLDTRLVTYQTDEHGQPV